MHAVGQISPSEPARPACPDAAHSSAAEPLSTGRSLVVLGCAAGPGSGSAGPRPSAIFLVQLIATAQQAPQTRQRRRAEPHCANASYAAAATPAAWIGRALYRAS